MEEPGVLVHRLNDTYTQQLDRVVLLTSDDEHVGFKLGAGVVVPLDGPTKVEDGSVHVLDGSWSVHT